MFLTKENLTYKPHFGYYRKYDGYVTFSTTENAIDIPYFQQYSIYDRHVMFSATENVRCCQEIQIFKCPVGFLKLPA